MIKPTVSVREARYCIGIRLALGEKLSQHTGNGINFILVMLYKFKQVFGNCCTGNNSLIKQKLGRRFDLSQKIHALMWRGKRFQSRLGWKPPIDFILPITANHLGYFFSLEFLGGIISFLEN
jgi:hypothetical protein